MVLINTYLNRLNFWSTISFLHVDIDLNVIILNTFQRKMTCNACKFVWSSVAYLYFSNNNWHIYGFSKNKNALISQLYWRFALEFSIFCQVCQSHTGDTSRLSKKPQGLFKYLHLIFVSIMRLNCVKCRRKNFINAEITKIYNWRPSRSDVLHKVIWWKISWIWNVPMVLTRIYGWKCRLIQNMWILCNQISLYG